MYIIHIPHANTQGRKEAIKRLLLNTEHNCSPEYIDYLAKQSAGQSYREIERAIGKAIMRAERLEEKVEKKHIELFIKEWYSPYNPLFIYQLSKKHIKPFAKEVLPIMLQAIGTGSSGYFSLLQTRSTAKQFEMQKEGLELQKKAAGFNWLGWAGVVVSAAGVIVMYVVKK